MIHRNIGKTERIVRFICAVILIALVAAGKQLGWLQGLALIVAAALLWNSIFARCYLWKWLNLSSAESSAASCSDDKCDAGGSNA